MNRRIINILFLLLCSGAWAQSTNISTFFKSSLKKADHFYEHFAYRNALEVYLHVNEKESSNVYVREQIADCYFKLHNPVEAERWFEELAKDDAISAKSKFEYAEALSMNGKYGESLYWFEAYLKDKPNDTTALEKLKFLQNIDYYNNSIDKFNIHGIANINTEHAEYGAHVFHDGVVFASSRDTQHLIKHKPADAVHPDEALLNLFFVVPQVGDDGGTDPREFHEEDIKTRFHEGPMAFYNNYKRGAFTRSNLNNGVSVRNEDSKVTLQIYFADVNHLGGLQNIQAFDHYHEEYSNAHPTFTEDGKKMYFTSTRPAGKGGSDIYYCEWQNGKWTYPVNAGQDINTPEDESFPFLLNDSTLFFSSNGHGTLGGLDMYVSYKKRGKFTKPFNLGAPANSRFDDFSLVFDSAGRNGYMASNRPGGKGLDDIYFFETKYYELVGVVRELSTGQPVIPNTLITVKKSGGGFVDSVRSDQNGYFHLRLEYDQNFILTGAKEGYESLEGLNFSTWNKPYGVDSLTLPLWKHKLFAKGTIYSNETQTPLEGAVVVLKNITDGSADSLTMGKEGKYSFLATPNKLYELQVKKEGYLPNGFKLNTKDLLEGDLLNDVVLEEPYMEKSLVLFDYNAATFMESFKADLNKLVRALKRYPNSTVWIGAHADSRGTPEYNLELSNRRAQTVVEYLKSNGISEKRIEAIGFGEELILNRCSSGVECSDEEHSPNRRAEVKIQKAVD